MTACSNSRRHGAVVAALVGAMSLGAPAVALAANGGIEVLAANWTVNAKVTRATDGRGNPLSGDLSKMTFTQGSGKFLVPTEVTGDFATVRPTTDDLTYTRTGDSDPIGYDDMCKFAKTGSLATDTYYVHVKVDDYTAKFAFKVTKNESTLAGAYVADEDGNKDLVYTGEELELSVFDADGDKIEGATVSYKKADGSDVTSVKGAGKYTATITKGSESVKYFFEMAKFDVSKVTPKVLVKDSYAGYSYSKLFDEILGFTATSDNGVWDLQTVSLKDPSGNLVSINHITPNELTTKGKYTVSVKFIDTDNTVAGERDVDFWVVDDDLSTATLKYGNANAKDGITIDLSEGQKFDLSKVKLDTEYGTFSAGDMEVSFTKSGKPVTADDVANASVSDTFEMTAFLKPDTNFEDGKVYGGTKTCTIKVIGTDLAEDQSLAFYLDGEIAGDKKTVTYDGTD